MISLVALLSVGSPLVELLSSTLSPSSKLGLHKENVKTPTSLLRGAELDEHFGSSGATRPLLLCGKGNDPSDRCASEA